MKEEKGGGEGGEGERGRGIDVKLAALSSLFLRCITVHLTRLSTI